MNEETKNKQAAEPQEWLMPDEIEIIETSDPKVMLDKWLAEPVARKYTEDFVDDSTGEIVSVERTADHDWHILFAGHCAAYNIPHAGRGHRDGEGIGATAVEQAHGIADDELYRERGQYDTADGIHIRCGRTDTRGSSEGCDGLLQGVLLAECCRGLHGK